MVWFPISEHRKGFVVYSRGLSGARTLIFSGLALMICRVHWIPVLSLWWSFGVVVTRDVLNPPMCWALGMVAAWSQGWLALDNRIYPRKALHLAEVSCSFSLHFAWQEVLSVLSWCWHAGAPGKLCGEALGCPAQRVPDVPRSVPDTAPVAVWYFLEICPAAVPVTLASSSSFVLFPEAGSWGDNPADPLTWQCGCCSTASQSSLLQPTPVSALLLPPCSPTWGTQPCPDACPWLGCHTAGPRGPLSRPGFHHFPVQTSVLLSGFCGTPKRSWCCGGLYQCRTLRKSYFQHRTRCFSFSLTSICLLGIFEPFRKKLFYPPHDQKYCFIFPYSWWEQSSL